MNDSDRVTVREYMERMLTDCQVYCKGQFAEADKRYEQRFQAQEKATSRYAEDVKAWQAGANEWRQAMNDKDRLLIPRREVEDKVAVMLGDIVDLKQSRDLAQGKASQLSVNITLAIAIISMAIGIINLFI